MTNENLLEIIKQKGIGKYLGKLKTNLEEIEGYESYIQLCSTMNNEYYVNLFTNSQIENFNESLCLYNGNNKNEAERIFNRMVEKDKKIKQNLAHEVFSKN